MTLVRTWYVPFIPDLLTYWFRIYLLIFQSRDGTDVGRAREDVPGGDAKGEAE